MSLLSEKLCELLECRASSGRIREWYSVFVSNPQEDHIFFCCVCIVCDLDVGTLTCWHDRNCCEFLHLYLRNSTAGAEFLSLDRIMLPLVAVVVGVVLFEATMVMSTTLCGELYLFSSRRKQHSHGVMWRGGHSTEAKRCEAARIEKQAWFYLDFNYSPLFINSIQASSGDIFAISVWIRNKLRSTFRRKLIAHRLIIFLPLQAANSKLQDECFSIHASCSQFWVQFCSHFSSYKLLQLLIHPPPLVQWSSSASFFSN